MLPSVPASLLATRWSYGRLHFFPDCVGKSTNSKLLFAEMLSIDSAELSVVADIEAEAEG